MTLDGTLAFIERHGYGLMHRRRADMTDRYPEFAFLLYVMTVLLTVTFVTWRDVNTTGPCDSPRSLRRRLGAFP